MKHTVYNRDPNCRINTVYNVVDNSVYIYDYVGTVSPWYDEDKPESDQVTSEQFLTTIRNIAGDIVVRINSQGGEVGYALSIYQTLMEKTGKVTCVVDGYAYSCASWILLAGEEREIMPGGIVMTHNPGMYSFHDSENSFNSALQQWKANRDSVANITATRTGLKIEEVYDMMEKQTFMNASDAVSKGFCTKVREGKASIPKGVGNYLPSVIRDAIPEITNIDYSDLLTKSALFRSKKLINR